MSVGSQLSKLIKDRGTNVNQLAQEIGVLPQYLYKVIDRDSQRVDIVTLQLIASAMDVPLEYFAGVEDKTLTSAEADLLKYYHQADDQGRKIIQSVAQLEAERKQ